jgi:hypothetical protein
MCASKGRHRADTNHLGRQNQKLRALERILGDPTLAGELVLDTPGMGKALDEHQSARLKVTRNNVTQDEPVLVETKSSHARTSVPTS